MDELSQSLLPCPFTLTPFSGLGTPSEASHRDLAASNGDGNQSAYRPSSRHQWQNQFLRRLLDGLVACVVLPRHSDLHSTGAKCRRRQCERNHRERSNPQQTTYLQADVSQGSFNAPPVGSAGTLTWNAGSLAPGPTATLKLQVKVTARGKDVIVNSATVTTTSFEVNTANNSATITTRRTVK